MLRRYGFFQSKTLIRKLTLRQSHQKTCHSSTLRVFSVKNTHSQTDITTKSSKNLPCFDVTGFLLKKTHSQTDITTKSSKNLPFFDVTGFFSKKHSFAN